MQNFNAKELLEVAIQNEKNGVEFYTDLAERTENPEVRKVLLELVKQEQGHIQTIKKIINDFLEEEGGLSYYDDPEALLYLQAIAAATLFTDDVKAVGIKVVLKDTHAALHYAVDTEIKSIEFYNQVLHAMANNSGQEAIEKLIVDEKGHVTTLYKMIKEYE